MGSWPGRRASSAVRTTRGRDVGSAMESTGLEETAEIGGGGRKGRSRVETHSRRHIHWESGCGGGKVRVVRDELRQIGG